MKILVIGQAPPAVAQSLPYDTTMLYEWLEEVGVNIHQAQSMFEWEAVSDKFPGFKMGGGHLMPSAEDMERHWENTLKTKVKCSDKVWILGGVAAEFLTSKDEVLEKRTLYTMHPSRRNRSMYKDRKESLINDIRNFLK